MTDNFTGLVWTRSANLFGTISWNAAIGACAQLCDGLFDDFTDGSQPGDWRLPNIRELESLVDHGSPYLATGGFALSEGHPFTQADSGTDSYVLY